MKKLVVLFSILFLASCSGTGKNVGLLYQELKTNQTKIFVKRETGFQGMAALIKVSLNGSKVGVLGDNESLSASTNVGSGIVSAGYTGIASIGMSDVSKSFTIKQGEKLFFVISQKIGLIGGTVRIFQVYQNDFFSN